MIQHNPTLAWRQLVKYRLQSAVSVVSLAIGFACFALASMWIKYETTYDGFHKDADRILLDFFFGKQREERNLCTVNFCHQLTINVKRKGLIAKKLCVPL